MLKKVDVQNKKFNITRKGYDVSQVDALLDAVAETLSEYEANAQELEKFRSLEKQLSSALVMAQTTAANVQEKAAAEADEKLKSAEEQASRILEEANKEAQNQITSLENEKTELLNKIVSLKGFVENYKACILKDMQNNLVSFEQGFLSDATYEEIKEEIPENEEAAEPETLEETSEEVACEDKDEEKKENEQLDTGDMESIDLSEIVNNLPNADDELKALIDKML